jgi:hypothetical protein
VGECPKPRNTRLLLLRVLNNLNSHKNEVGSAGTELVERRRAPFPRFCITNAKKPTQEYAEI